MLLVHGVVLSIFAKMVNIGKCKLLCFGNAKNFFAFLLVKELSVLVEEFEGIPLTWVVTCRKNDAAVGAKHCYSQFGGWCCCKTDVNNIESHSHESSANNVLYHLARDTSISAYYDFSRLNLTCLAYKSCIRRSKFYDVKRVQSFSCGTADCSADARN